MFTKNTATSTTARNSSQRHRRALSRIRHRPLLRRRYSRRGAAPRARGEPSDPLAQEEVDRDGGEDQRAEHGVPPELAEPRHTQEAQVEQVDEDRPQQRADERPRPSEDV